MKNFRQCSILDRRVKYRTIFAVMFIFILALISARAVFPQTVEGNVVRWFDGDTVQFRAKNGKYYRIRLQGIDAPERRQTGGIECTDYLIELTKAKTVTATLFGRDTYKRWLGRLATADFPDINLEMINHGCAWEYSAPLAVKTMYQTKEQEARSENIKLWSDPCPTEPWSFRASGYKTCD